jgi:hypothetical protein
MNSLSVTIYQYGSCHILDQYLLQCNIPCHVFALSMIKSHNITTSPYSCAQCQTTLMIMIRTSEADGAIEADAVT